MRHVVALNDHLAPFAGTGETDDDEAAEALAEILLDRRGWASWCLTQLGDSAAQAIEFGEPLVADYTRVLGEGHEKTMTSRNNLGVAYRMAGRVWEAIPLLERTLADSVRVLGEGHWDTLGSRNNLAETYVVAGRVEDAIPLFEQALAGLERALGREHPSTGIVRENLTAARREAERRRGNPPA